MYDSQPPAPRRAPKPPFAKVPKVGRGGLLPHLGRADLRVLIAICEHLPDAFPSVPTIAKLSGLSTRAVNDARNRLKALGVLTWSKPSPRRRSCLYHVVFKLMPPSGAGERCFTPDVNPESAPEGRAHHCPDDASFTQSKARQEREGIKKNEQDRPEIRATETRSDRQLDATLPDATPAEVAAARSALLSYGVKPHTVYQLLAGHPYLLAESVHALWSLCRQRAPRNPQGYLVKLVRDEGATVTAELRACRPPAPDAEKPPRTAADPPDAPLAAPSPKAQQSQRAVQPDPTFRANLRARDQLREAIAAETDAETRERLEAELEQLRTAI